MHDAFARFMIFIPATDNNHFVQDRCFGKAVWKEIQQAFEPYIKKKSLILQKFMMTLEGNQMRTNRCLF